MQAFENKNGAPILRGMVETIQENKDYLGEIDGLIGDGDHGMNMNKGFSLFGERHLSGDIAFTDGLSELGAVLLEEIGGSMGPIYGTIFMEMADAGDGNDTIDLALFAQMMRAGLEGLEAIVDAKVGDKTLVDTLAPAVDALTEAEAEGKGFAEALLAATFAAKEGQESTKDLVAKFGRSSRLGERSRGVIDAGATSCYLLLKSMMEGIAKQI
ncbi:MAG: dihydroxyacetone kinase subunit L [Clostridiales Family XIII bacterium]|jgi:dihydroxyacetone kinase-like protein|nr:dihydroxyacetone kinase subunit L [Clostridiales Family XIII bacterium]